MLQKLCKMWESQYWLFPDYVCNDECKLEVLEIPNRYARDWSQLETDKGNQFQFCSDDHGWS